MSSEVIETPIETPIENKQEEVQNVDVIEQPIEKMAITRDQDPAKLKKKEYQTRYRQKLKERAANGDEKAIEVINKNLERLENMRAKQLMTKDDVKKEREQLKEEQKRLALEKELKEKQDIENIKKRKEELEQIKLTKDELKNELKTELVDTNEYVLKPKYKKLKERVKEMTNEIEKLRGTVKPKYNTDIYKALFGN